MVYEDRLTIDTPEGVPLELTLAGLGSRFAAALIDYLIEGVIIVALLLVLGYGVGSHPRRQRDCRRRLGCGLLRRSSGATTSPSRC